MSTSNSSKKITQQKFSSLLQKKSPAFKKIIKTTWITLVSVIVFICAYFLSVDINLFGLFGDMPRLNAIENPQNDLSSELISADGVSLGRYFRFNRSQVTYDQLSPDLVNTLLLSEDHRFYDHAGMDFWAYPRVLWGLITLQNAGGGSTITQQLAKNLYTINPELDGHLSKWGKYPRRIIQKSKEWIISIHLEKNFTKEEIIAMYLNTSSFSSNAYGIKVASETYFNKQPKDLNIPESAILVGMLQNPSLYNPNRNPNNALRKRNEVLYKLYDHKYIASQDAYDSIRQLPIKLDFHVQNHNQGIATYFRNVLRNDLMAWCKENGHDLWDSGLKIYTTIDSRMQRLAEESMAEHMSKLQKDFERQWKYLNKNPWVDEDKNEIKDFLIQRIKRTDAYRNLVKRYGSDSDSVNIMLNKKKEMTIFTWKGERDTLFSSMDSLRYYKRFLQSSSMSMDPRTGAIKAWVGGLNHKFFKYDMVKQGSRQAGSTFKPFVYGTAIEAGYSPCHELYDISPAIKVSGTVWHPSNADGSKGSGKKVTIRKAMAESLNTVTAQVMVSVGPENVVQFARRLGITSPLDAVPSLSLGTSDVSLFEMVAAYCAFVNLGISIEPYYITRIEDKNGNVLENFVPKTKQSLDEQTAYKMVYMLQGAVQEAGGTSLGLSYDLKVNNEIGGKTGTTQNASDGWYIGVTHNLVTGVWVGGDERSIHFPSWQFGAGTRSARPIWDKYMTKVYRDKELGYGKGYFKRPSQLNTTLDCRQFNSSDSTAAPEDTWSIQR